MKKISKIIVVCGLILGNLCLTSCGRYSEPSPVEGSNFPHNYPQH